MSAVLKELPRQHRAHLLVDERGPYGIHVDTNSHWGVNTIIARADRIASIDQSKNSVPSLFHAAPRQDAPWAKHATETGLCQTLHRSWLAERGVMDDAGQFNGEPNWRLYHGLKRSATRIINGLLLELYAAAIPVEHQRLIRRYPISTRPMLYRGLCQAGERAWQLAESFPLLATVIYGMRSITDRDVDRRKSAHELVLAGGKLRDIASSIGVPMEFRRFAPAVSNGRGVFEFLSRHPRIVAHHCPDTVPRQRAWLKAVAAASQDEDFALWVATHFERIGHWRSVPAIVSDMRDWVSAGTVNKTLDDIDPRQIERICDAIRATGSNGGLAGWLGTWWRECDRKNFGVRNFSASLAPQTAIRLSAEWHERAAQAEAARLPFPEPWYDGAATGDYRIEPITNSVDLTRFAHQLHNCATQYAQSVARGDCYLYVVTNGTEKPLGMLELQRGDMPTLAQLKGPCNQTVKKPIQRAVTRWLARARQSHGVGRMARVTALTTDLVPDDFDMDIPF